jgi:hypothetical protein
MMAPADDGAPPTHVVLAGPVGEQWLGKYTLLRWKLSGRRPVYKKGNLILRFRDDGDEGAWQVSREGESQCFIKARDFAQHPHLIKKGAWFTPEYPAGAEFDNGIPIDVRVRYPEWRVLALAGGGASSDLADAGKEMFASVVCGDAAEED